MTPDSSSPKWSSFKDTVAQAAKEVLGTKTRSHVDWFDENDQKIKDALHAKNKSYIEWQNDPSSVAIRERFKTLQTKVQSDLRHKAAEVQRYADTHNTKRFFSSSKTVWLLRFKLLPTTAVSYTHLTLPTKLEV